MTDDTNRGALDITACEREPIHIPGRVQPHGLLLALRESDMTVLQASANAEALLGRTAESLGGQPLESLLDSEPVGRLREALLCERVMVVPLRLFTLCVHGCDTLFDATAHCGGDDVLILELEPQAASPPAGTPDLNYTLKTGFPRLAEAETLVAFCDAAAELVRRITGFDRVMVYRFDDEWNGEVIAENRRADWEPFLGLRYPASDIPRQARELYLKNALRLIVDVHGEPVPLVPALNPRTGSSLDMTHAILRAVSPVHIEYLKNMGVGASMSSAILRGGALWGLVACHHGEARFVPYDVRNACEILGQVVSLLVPEKEASGEHGYALRLRGALAGLVASMASARDVLRGLVDTTPSVADFVEAGGAAVCLDGKTLLLGNTPDEAAVRELSAWLSRRAVGDMYASASLARDYAPALAWTDVASGLLAVPLSRVNRSFVLWFRPEVARTVNWAGEPRKRVEVQNDGTERLSPRRSFALWQEAVRGESLPWRRAEIDAARDLRQAVVDALLQQSEARSGEEARHVAFERQRRIAATLQSSLLTPIPEAGVGGLAVTARYEAAWSEAQVGGDFYDALALPDGRVLLAVGDVTGKGLAAAEHIMEAKFALRALAVEHGGEPGECLTRLNALLATTNGGDVSSPIALALALVAPDTGRAWAASAGAEYPLLVRAGAGGSVRPLKAGGLALGVLPDERYVSEGTFLAPDELLVMVTDGITEARAPQAKPDGTPAFLDGEGVADLLAALPPDASPVEAARALLEGARRFAGGTFRDDACLLVARRKPGHPAPPGVF